MSHGTSRVGKIFLSPLPGASLGEKIYKTNEHDDLENYQSVSFKIWSEGAVYSALHRFQQNFSYWPKWGSRRGMKKFEIGVFYFSDGLF